jgi:uncharacterized protein (TIGR00290 family)
MKSISHGLDSRWIAMQAEAMGVPLIQKFVQWGSYKQGLGEVIAEVKQQGVTAEVFGDIYLQEHKDWLDSVCAELGITPVMPLWNQPTDRLISDFIELGFETIVVAVKSDLMGKEWLGQRIDKAFVERLSRHNGGSIDLCGEKGEFHSFVIDGPVFHKRLQVVTGDIVEDSGRFLLEIPRCTLVAK